MGHIWRAPFRAHPRKRAAAPRPLGPGERAAARACRERGFRVTDSGLTLVTPDMLGQQLHFTR